MIYIDANEANVPHPVGSNVFVQQLLTALQKIWLPSDPQITLLLNKPPRTSFFKTLSWPIETIPPSFFWTQWRLPLYLFKNKPKIIFTPGHYAPRFKPKGTKSIITIFDLAFLHFPHYFTSKDLWQLKLWTKYSVHQADLIFTISQATKTDIQSTYSIPSERIKIIHPGVKWSDNNKVEQKTLSDYKKLLLKNDLKKKKYFLFVGTLQPRKNIANLINAFLQLKTDYKLVLIGKKGWLFEKEIAPILYPAIRSKRVIWLEFVSDSLLPFFYKDAFFIVLPSFWEGFGLPIIEAGYFSTPALVSANSSLTELVNDKKLHILPPFSVQQIKTSLERMLKLKENEYETLSQQAQERSKKFNWLKSAELIRKQLLQLH